MSDLYKSKPSAYCPDCHSEWVKEKVVFMTASGVEYDMHLVHCPDCEKVCDSQTWVDDNK